MRKIKLVTLQNTPAVAPSDLRDCINLAATFGQGRTDAEWLRPYEKAIQARWSDKDTRLALWTRTRALLAWTANPAVLQADVLQRQAWFTTSILEGVDSPHPALSEWDARLRAAASYPCTADGLFDMGFRQAITEAKVTAN